MAGLEFDFVLYLGDPDEGAETVESRALVQDLDRYKDRIDGSGPMGPYGALVVKQDGKSLLAPRPDPVLHLITHLLKAVPYVVDGEAESILLSESEHGITVAGGADNVVVTFFAGDAFEPDELLLPETPAPMDTFGTQVVGMGERLRTVVDAVAPDLLTDGALAEFLELADEAVKKYKLEVERGIRAT